VGSDLTILTCQLGAVGEREQFLQASKLQYVSETHRIGQGLKVYGVKGSRIE
jgi:hypothetical protein